MIKKNDFILKCKTPHCPNFAENEIIVGSVRLALCNDCMNNLKDEISLCQEKLSKTTSTKNTIC